MTVAPFSPGSKFARYEIVRELGRGAIGETFAARVMDGPRQGELVCLKILARQHLGARSGEREAAIRSLRHEARVVAGLVHPNIAQLFDSGVYEDRWYLALELVTGVNLSEAMACGPLGAPHVMHIGLEVAKALACAHGHDVLHRDIKPSNILIGTDGEVKLVDFGLAKLHAGASAEFTHHVGTPRYFAPEQLRAEALSPATDIYAVGLVLFELLTGSHPFYSADADEFQRNIVDGLPQQTLRGRGLPADLVAIVECCIQRDSATRFANGFALENAFAAAVERSLDDSLWDMRIGPDPATALPGAGATAAERAEDVPTRVGRLADRVADIRDEPADLTKGLPDFPTRAVEDPTAAYRRVTKAFAPAELAAQVAKSMPVQSESIMGDLSRLARAITDQRSAGLEPAQQHRSGVRPVDEATPPGRRRSRTTAYGYADPGSRPTESSEQAPTAPQQDNAQAPGHPTNIVVRPPKARWIAAGVVVAIAAFLAVLTLTPEVSRRSEGKGGPSAEQPLRSRPGESTSRTPVPATTSGPLEQPSDHPVHSTPPDPAEAAVPATAEDESSRDEQPAAADVAPPPTTNRPSKARQAEAVDLVQVTIGVIPFGEVIVDGKVVGAAPVVVKLALGKHRIVARSRQLRRVRTIEVKAETDLVVLDLRNVESSP